MASLEYEQIFSRFRTKVRPYEYLDLSDTQVFEFECNWLRTTFAKSAFRKQFSSLLIDDDMEEVVYILSNPLDDFSDEEFVLDVASTGMACAWMQPKVYSTTNMAQTYGTSELKLKNFLWSSYGSSYKETSMMYPHEYAGTPLELLLLRYI